MKDAITWAISIAAIMLCGAWLARSHAAPVQQHAPMPAGVIPASLVIVHSDISFAKEACKHRGLAWSRLEVSDDGTHVGVVCESEAIVRAQIQAHWQEIVGGRR